MQQLSDRISKLPPEKQALFKRMLKQKGLSDAQDGAIPRVKDSHSYPLSFAQQRLWFLEQMEPGNPFYNEPLLALRIKGVLDRNAIEETFNALVIRHESLRARFASVDGKPVQIIEPATSVPIVFHDLLSLPLALRESEITKLAQEEASRPFDLSHGSLFRVSLLKLAEHEHAVFLEMHHIITDGWSNSILINEILQLYEAFSKKQKNTLPLVPIRYVDFADWQTKHLTGVTLEKLVDYWKKQLSGHLPVSEFPLDFPRPAVQRYRGRVETNLIGGELSNKIRLLAKKQDCTLFMTLLAAFVVLLQRYTGQNEIVIGTPVANRNRKETESVVGFFVNTLVIRIDMSDGPSFTQLMSRVRKTAIDAYAHEDLPFEKLVEILRPKRNLDKQALFQILFGLHNYPSSGQEVQSDSDDLQLSRMEVDGGESKMDWAMSITDLNEEGIKAQINYNTDLYRLSTMQRIHAEYETILQHVVLEPETYLNSIPIFSSGEDKVAIGNPPKKQAIREKLKSVRRTPIPIDSKGDNS